MLSLKSRLLEVCTKEESDFPGLTAGHPSNQGRHGLICSIRLILGKEDWQDEKELIKKLAFTLTSHLYPLRGSLFSAFFKKLWNQIVPPSESLEPIEACVFQKINNLMHKINALYREDFCRRLTKVRDPQQYSDVLSSVSSAKGYEESIRIISSLMRAQLLTYNNILKLNSITCVDTCEILSNIHFSLLTQRAFDVITALSIDQLRTIQSNLLHLDKLYIYLYFIELNNGKYAQKNIADKFFEHIYLYSILQTTKNKSLVDALRSLYRNKFKNPEDLTYQDFENFALDIEVVTENRKNLLELLSQAYCEEAQHFNHGTTFFETILLPRLKILNDPIKNEVFYLLLTTRFPNNQVIETENLELFKLIDPVFDESFVMNHAKNIRLDEIFRQLLRFYEYMYDSASDNAEKEDFLIMLREFVTASFESPCPVFLIFTLDILKNLADQKEGQLSISCIYILLNLHKNFYQSIVLLENNGSDFAGILFDLGKLSDINCYSIKFFKSALRILATVNSNLSNSTFSSNEKIAIFNDIDEEYKLIDYAVQELTQEHVNSNKTLTEKSCILYRSVQQKELSIEISAGFKG